MPGERMPLPCWRCRRVGFGGSARSWRLRSSSPRCSAGDRSPRPPGPDAATSSIDWHRCDTSFECGTLVVPLDYGDPEGPTINLAVVRAKARDPERRIGSLLINPGGPGAPGVSYTEGLADVLPHELRDRFDLVGFDPRGIGESEAVHCGADVDPVFDQSFSPTTPRERAALIAAFRTLVDACARDSARLLPHVSTVDTARDLDRLRATLGDQKLTYVGPVVRDLPGDAVRHDVSHRVRGTRARRRDRSGRRRFRGRARAGSRVRAHARRLSCRLRETPRLRVPPRGPTGRCLRRAPRAGGEHAAQDEGQRGPYRERHPVRCCRRRTALRRPRQLAGTGSGTGRRRAGRRVDAAPLGRRLRGAPIGRAVARRARRLLGDHLPRRSAGGRRRRRRALQALATEPRPGSAPFS